MGLISLRIKEEGEEEEGRKEIKESWKNGQMRDKGKKRVRRRRGRR